MDEMGWPGPFSVTVTALWAYWFTGYQVFMAEHLKPAQRLEYLNFGHAFMSSFYNMQRSAFQYALLHWSICQDPVYEEWWKPNPSSFIIDERNEVFLLLFSMEVQIGNCTSFYITFLWSALAFALKVIQLHAHGFKQLFLHVCVIILIGSIYFAY